MAKSTCDKHVHPSAGCMLCPSRFDGVFSDLNESDVEELDRVKVTNQYKRGQIIFHEGSPSLGIYCVFDGQIKILRNSEDGEEVISRIAAGGSTLGLRGVLTDREHPATAKVMQDATICFIERRFFKDLVARSPALASRVMFMLAEEVSRLERSLEDVTTKDVRQRLACLLLSFVPTFGIRKPLKPKGYEIYLDLKITRAEIASMIGTSPETVIRMLSDMNAEGILRLDGKAITVVDDDALAEVAGVSI